MIELIKEISKFLLVVDAISTITKIFILISGFIAIGILESLQKLSLMS